MYVAVLFCDRRISAGGVVKAFIILRNQAIARQP
jgi:hypothetical protein